MKPVVTYVIPTRNRSTAVRKFLTKILKLSKGVSSEIIVIDNASEDNTYEVIQRNFPEVRLFKNDINSGAEARNIGIRESRTDYICMLDDDSYPLSDAVKKGIEVLERDPKIGCLAYRIAMPRGRFWTNGIYTTFAGCGALFCKKALSDIGGYPGGYGFYVEEYDVSFRLWAKGYRLVNSKDLTIYHEQINKGRDTNSILSLLVCNNVKLYSKFFPIDIAISQIEFELWRYKAIAKKENVMDGYVKGLELSFRRLLENYQDEVTCFSPELCRRVLGLDAAEVRISDFMRQCNAKRVLVHTVGKLTPSIIKIIRSCGGEVVAILNENPGLYGHELHQVKISSPSEFTSAAFEAIVCGSSSLVVNDAVEQAIKTNSRMKDAPFLRICDYDG